MKGFRLKYWIVPITLVIALTVAFETGILSLSRAQKQVASPEVMSVTVNEAQFVGKMPKLNLTGSIEGDTSAVISAKIAGRIEQVLVEDGQAVTAGQPLLRLESIELANAVRTSNDALRRAQANYENVANDYRRYQSLYAQNAVSQQTLDGAETDLKVAAADLSSAKAALSTAEEQHANAVVAAPVNGVVANKAAVIGQVVSAGMTLMTVENISQVYAVVNIEQKDLAAVKPGVEAEVTVDTYPGQAFTGKVEIMNPAAAVANRMYRTKIRLDNTDGLLKPGMFIKANIVTGQEMRVLAVPQAAIYQKQGLYYVYTLEDDKAVRHQVEIGTVIGDLIEIKSGIQAKTMVITSNVNKLKDGDTVQVTR
ncbi:MAG TPA: efflux RND transporter periplasmic adaptor subunit [Methylomusa anaerophila]|uniref:Multidrug resistance protein MdtE n=1 Tax=Methylomusa anaerophila TaxID=1930071 RepID=A0A348AHZ4_9FIRM|nr:efflux RND transporter periplasmic adaptor subunit [Methylomusa anaerophila]BBB90692.1 multidrug resistance protein MdtE precursor [Methylomusa anaerophila]HML88705.1 efflux RND transporter periplasmic adaptor subunit [Methylomusa anaerophila]